MPCVSQIGDAGQLTFEWEIRDFFSLSYTDGDSYISPSFSFHDTQWHLRVYPARDGLKEIVSLYLWRGDSGPPKAMSYTLGVKSSDGVVGEVDCVYKFCEKDQGYGCPAFLSKSDLKNRQSVLMPNDVLTLTCVLKSDESSAVNDTPSKSTDQAVQAVLSGEEKVLKSLLSLLESGEDSDVVIKVQEKEFPAHRAILRARSVVFRSMFAHDMVEKNSGVVTIKDCDEATFPAFLVHLYSGSCVLSSENVCSLYVAADKYDVGDLKGECSEFLKRNITVQCFSRVIALAVKHNDKELIDCATRFFCDNSVEIAKTTEWQTFLAENATVGNELFIKAMSSYVRLFDVCKS